MAIASANGKYLTLEDVRVFYDKDNDQIVITSKDPDIPADSKGFKISVNSSNETGFTLRRMLGERGMVPGYQEDLSPEHVNRSDLPKDYPWHTIPLGKSSENSIISWDTRESPNMFIVGYAGSGKSNTVYNVLDHCLAHPENWEVAVFDPKFGDRYSKDFPGISEIGLTNFGIHAGLLYYMNELQKREQDPSSAKKDILLIAEDQILFFSETGEKKEQTKEVIEEKRRRKEAGEFFMELAKRGKAVGIHLLMTAQILYHNPLLPNQLFLPHFDAKMVCGNYNSIGLRLFTDNSIPLYVKPRPGRSYLMDKKGNRAFQTSRYEFKA